jgi:hypothetical protein
MAIVVIGGHTRNIGKTSVMCRLLAAFPENRWTAIKITQFGHGICSANGESCECEIEDHPVAISEERNSNSGTDSSRYLGAGAARSVWVRTRQGQLAEAMPRIRREIAAATNVVIESNSVLRFLRPDLYLAVLDTSIADFKPTALRYLDRADAILLPGGDSTRPVWTGVSPQIIAGIPAFKIPKSTYWSAEVEQFVRAHLSNLTAHARPVET